MRYLLFLFIGLFVSCSPLKKGLQEYQAFGETQGGFIGYEIINLHNGKTIAQHHHQHLFTPASATKLHTFALADERLDDSQQPWLIYSAIQDSLFIQGTGHPGFLLPSFQGLKDTFPVFFDTFTHYFVCPASPTLAKYGSGWAWDDASYLFQKPRTSLPIHGNEILVYDNQGYPYLPKGEEEKWRILDSLRIPAPMVETDLAKALSLTTEKEWKTGCSTDSTNEVLLTSTIPMDSLYQLMLTDSDNFIAEQLGLLASWKTTSYYDTKPLMDSTLATYYDRRNGPFLYDAAGLSRYNKMSPHQLNLLLQKLYTEVSLERLQLLLPQNGKGTLSGLTRADQKAILFAKTGSMRGIYVLSGYLRSKKGNWLAVTFMNNNFTASRREIQQEVWKICNQLYEKY